MSILFFLVPVALLLAGCSVAAFLWAARYGQFDDLQTPAVRILLDEIEENERAVPSVDKRCKKTVPVR